jgi:hypothetical protein
VGEVGVVSSDFHRLKSATANQSPKNSQSNQVICAFFFFQTGSESLAGTMHDSSCLMDETILGCYRSGLSSLEYWCLHPRHQEIVVQTSAQNRGQLANSMRDNYQLPLMRVEPFSPRSGGRAPEAATRLNVRQLFQLSRRLCRHVLLTPAMAVVMAVVFAASSSRA